MCLLEQMCKAVHFDDMGTILTAKLLVIQIYHDIILITDHLNKSSVMLESLYFAILKVGLKIDFSTFQAMTNLVLNKNILLVGKIIQLTAAYKYLGQEISFN